MQGPGSRVPALPQRSDAVPAQDGRDRPRRQGGAGPVWGREGIIGSWACAGAPIPALTADPLPPHTHATTKTHSTHTTLETHVMRAPSDHGRRRRGRRRGGRRRRVHQPRGQAGAHGVVGNVNLHWMAARRPFGPRSAGHLPQHSTISPRLPSIPHTYAHMAPPSSGRHPHEHS